MPAKRGDRVAPPGRPGGWELRFATSEAAKANTWDAWVVMTETPTRAINPARQFILKRDLATRVANDKVLSQWQFEVTAGGRIWYCPDPDRRIVWLVEASPSHPKRTE